MYYDNEDAGDLTLSGAAGASEARFEEQVDDVLEFLNYSGPGYYDDAEDLRDDFRADHPKGYDWEDSVFEYALAQYAQEVEEPDEEPPAREPTVCRRCGDGYSYPDPNCPDCGGRGEAL